MVINEAAGTEETEWTGDRETRIQKLLTTTD